MKGETKGADISRWHVLYMYATCASFESILETKTLKISLTRDVNDPMENFLQTGHKNARVFQAERIRSELPPYFCFSKSITNPQLWGQYAEKNRGVCLAFVFPIFHETSESGIYSVLDKYAVTNMVWGDVIYAENRVRLTDGKDNDATLIFTKGKDWEYEEEVRCVCPYDLATSCENGKLFYSWPLDYLAGVIMGADCKYTKGYVLKKLELAFKHDNNVLFKEGILKQWIVSRAVENDILYEYHALPWVNNSNGKIFVDACNMAHGIKMLQDDVIGDAYEHNIGKLTMSKPMPWSEWATILKKYGISEVCRVLKLPYKASLPLMEEMGVRVEIISRIRFMLPKYFRKNVE